METLEQELKELARQGVDIGTMDFDLDIGSVDLGDVRIDEPAAEEEKKGKKWTTRGVRCDMKPQTAIREKNGRRYISLFASSEEGQTLEEIKNDRKCERLISEAAGKLIRELLGDNLARTGWAVITTGRRRHREGYHFATAVAGSIADGLGIPFCEGAIECGNADRLKPDLKLVRAPEEKNLILFDDIITTGTTMSKTADLLQASGYTVFCVIGIRNQ